MNRAMISTFTKTMIVCVGCLMTDDDNENENNNHDDEDVRDIII